MERYRYKNITLTEDYFEDEFKLGEAISPVIGSGCEKVDITKIDDNYHIHVITFYGAPTYNLEFKKLKKG